MFIEWPVIGYYRGILRDDGCTCTSYLLYSRMILTHSWTAGPGFKCIYQQGNDGDPMIPNHHVEGPNGNHVPGPLLFGKAFDYFFLYPIQNHWTSLNCEICEITYFGSWKPVEIPKIQSDSELLPESAGRQARATAPGDFGGGRLSGAGWSWGKSPGALWGGVGDRSIVVNIDAGFLCIGYYGYDWLWLATFGYLGYDWLWLAT